MLLAAAASADRGILPLLRAVLGPDELYSLVTIALLGFYANDLVRRFSGQIASNPVMGS